MFQTMSEIGGNQQNSWIRGLEISLHSMILANPDGLTVQDIERKTNFGDHGLSQYGYSSFESFLERVPNIYKHGNIYKARATAETADLHNMIQKQNKRKTIKTTRRLLVFKTGRRSIEFARKHVESKKTTKVACTLNNNLLPYTESYFNSPVQQEQQHVPISTNQIFSQSNEVINCKNNYFDMGIENNVLENHQRSNASESHISSFKEEHLANENSKPKLSNKFNIKGLIQQANSFNKQVDRKVIPQTRLALEQEVEVKTEEERLENDFRDLSISNSHIQTKGRGTPFGKLRSMNDEKSENHSSSSTELRTDNSARRGFSTDRSRSNNSTIKPESNRRTNFKSTQSSTSSSSIHVESPVSIPARLGTVGGGFGSSAKQMQSHQIVNKSTETPPYKKSEILTTPRRVETARRDQRNYMNLRKSDEVSNNSPPSETPRRSSPSETDNLLVKLNARPVNHQYYSMFLYGETRNEVLAQRIEKTVRHTEMPPRRF